jgi:beta-glucanase (GH16 family)
MGPDRRQSSMWALVLTVFLVLPNAGSIAPALAATATSTPPTTTATPAPAATAVPNPSSTPTTPTRTPLPTPTLKPSPTSTRTPAATVTPLATPGPGQSARLIFSDEFDGTTLDTSKWTTCYWWGQDGCTIASNGELEWYQPDDVLVGDGLVQLRAEKRTIKASDGKTDHYTSGMITTGRTGTDKSVPPRFSFLYGYTEIRAKIPKGQGLWPAFWLATADEKPLPEVDIMEIIGRKFPSMDMVLHYAAEDGSWRSTSRSWEGPDWSIDWHTFGLDWQPDAITWYVDGVQRFRYTTAAQIPAEPMVLVANLAVGGAWPGNPDGTTPFPSAYQIDYAKVWDGLPFIPKQPSAAEALTPAAPTTEPYGPVMIFDDEFDGTTLDATKWTTCYWWDNGGCTNSDNNELEWYLPDGVSVSDGTLKLQARKHTVTGSDKKTYQYTSGMITSGRSAEDDPKPDRFAFKYGYAEMRAKVPAGNGLSPAFWTLASSQQWPPDLIITNITGDQPNTTNISVHFFNADQSEGSSESTWSGPDFSTDWHTFGMDWQPNAVVWYVDGVERGRFADAAHIPSEAMYLVANLAVGGDFPGAPDVSTVFPSDFQIDYVRVWTGRPGAGVGAGPAIK